MPINVNYRHPLIAWVKGLVQHYNHEKYWRYRKFVTSPESKGVYPRIKKWLYLFYIKRCDAYNNSSFGTDMSAGALFKTPPKLPHGPNGIIISPYATIGKNCKIYQQVTIGDNGADYLSAPIIGDNVIIGAGAKITGKITIGNNVKIGTNAVVVENVPDNATVVAPKARIISKL